MGVISGIREIITAQSENLRNGFDVVITVLPAARDKEFLELEGAVVSSFKKLRLL